VGKGNPRLYPIYTELTECRDCYKCVRVCPVKAIQVVDQRATVVRQRCITCGKCVDICPSHAKKIRTDVQRAKNLINTNKRVIASLAPSYASEFPTTKEALLVALKKLGFSDISETAIGATLVSSAVDKFIERGEASNTISSACPAVVELVHRYHPDLVKNLSAVPSPLQTHCAYLRHLYGDDIKVVFIGPCIAKKVEADQNPGYPDIALTFRELKQWLDEEHIDLDALNNDDLVFEKLIPFEAAESTLYSVEGGMIASFAIGKDPFQDQAVSVSGVEQIMMTLNELKKVNNPNSPFLELLSCEGGCVNGPGRSHFSSPAINKANASKFTKTRISTRKEKGGSYTTFVSELVDKGYKILANEAPARGFAIEATPKSKFSEEQIHKALEQLGKHDIADELNCGGCGYNSCRDMAVAYLEGMAEQEMCVTRMRKLAQSKVDVLLRTLPMGVVIVDRHLNIMDCNSAFLHLFTDLESDLTDRGVDKISGLPLKNFVPFYGGFANQFEPNAKLREYRLHYKDKFLKVTFFSIENHRLVGAIFQDVTTPTVRRETVVKKADAVIQKSLETVQQIASLLGENAAETEIMLNSLIEAFQVPYKETSEAFTADLEKRKS